MIRKKCGSRGSTGALLPLRKIQALLWKMNLKHRRTSSTVLGCIDSPPPRRNSCPPFRFWFALLILLALVFYLFLPLQMPKNYEVFMRRLRMRDLKLNDIEIKIKNSDTSLCGFGCNFEGLSKAMKKRMNRIFKDFSGGLPPCEINMYGRGEVMVNETLVTASLQRWHFPTIRVGGYHTPADCQSRHKVAVIVPYRDDEPNLKVFLFNMHPFLMRQRIEYRIFVVEQTGHDKFNKGQLINVGFEQSHRFGHWPCLVFQDVNLLPLDERILYTCPTYPRHMSSTILGHKNGSELNRFSGVVSMKSEHFLKVNGYSNRFWGCCRVDSNMFWRIRSTGLKLSRYDKKIAKYLWLPPKSSDVNNEESIDTASDHHLSPAYVAKQLRRNQHDGISTTQYKVVSIRLRTLYTHILVDLNTNKTNQEIQTRYKFWLI